jgi:hypothetical protein|tara:strand:- start:228 stop:473 length:246 start_codon:yes stop_codon:yes gene_type:complete
MGDILEFTGEYHTRIKKSQECSEALANKILEHAENVGMDTNDQQFVYDFAWVVKFLGVLVDNDLGVANPLSKRMESMKEKL